MKPTVFISHITEEKDIAKALKEFIDKKFLKTINLFASSHEESIRFGDDWMSTIKQSMTDCQLIIMICSPISITRPWINFEAGAGWVRDIPVIPLCHSGLTPGKLPVPINTFQGGLLNDPNDIKKLFNRIASIMNSSVPDNDDQEYFNAVNAFEISIKNGLLIHDTNFINKLLERQVLLLKYCIYASTLDYTPLKSIDLVLANVINHKFTFNDIHYLFNLSLLEIHRNKKVFEVFHDTVNKLVDNAKFILNHNNLLIAPKIQDLLNMLLFTEPKIDDWFDHILNIDRQQNNAIKELSINMIKEESPLPPTRQISNLINHYIDYYDSLLFYQNWLTLYQTEMNNILK